MPPVKQSLTQQASSTPTAPFNLTTMVNVKANRIVMFVFLTLSLVVQIAAAVAGASVGWDTTLQAPAGSTLYIRPNDPLGQPPDWLGIITLQTAGRMNAGRLSMFALFPFLLIAIVTFYAGVKNKKVGKGYSAKPAIDSGFPEAALWTVFGVSLICMITNYAAIIDYSAFAKSGTFDPKLFQAPTCFGISITNAVLSLGALGLTIAALVKH